MNLSWTSTTPTTDGFYFFRSPDGEITICEISHDPEAGPATTPEETWMVEFLGDGDVYFAHDQGGDWAGPIQPPA